MTANGMEDGSVRPGAGLDAYAARLREVQEAVLSAERTNLLEAARLLAGSLDEKNKVGNRTRILKIEPGAFSTVPFVHEYWEEVFLVSGDLVCGSDAQGKGGESFTGPTYCVRPPGVHHGPFTSKNGCLLLETHYYVPK